MKTKNGTVLAASFLALACASSALADMATAVVEVKKSSKSKDGWRKECSIKVQYPTDAVSNVAKIINEYINERLGGSYAGDLFDGKAMVAHYIAECLASHQNEEATPYYPDVHRQEISNVAETDGYVTYAESTYYESEGMNHGREGYDGMTFRKSDGRRMGWEVFVNTDAAGFNNLVKKGLKQCWGLKTDAELQNHLTGGLAHDGISPDDIPAPAQTPLFVKEGVQFTYGSYEIAAYSMGMPQFVVPYAEIAPYLSRDAREMVEP